MTAKELRRKYIEFFEKNGHKEIETASLIPENDPSVLFTTAGMHPLVPYLLGEKHPSGNKLTNCQKCLRTGDIDEVGDASHLTFFEMMGNWSLGDYFKKESITMSNDFLINELGIPQERIYISVFGGDAEVEKDMETYSVWKSLGYPDSHIFFFSRKENWWGPAGVIGPCGPDTEIFYDTGKESCSSNCNPSCGCGKYVEIWNNVFMQYNKLEDGSFVPLSQKNVDTGLGLERVLAIMNSLESVYDTELFVPIIKAVEDATGTSFSEENTMSYRVICDHMRAATFVLGDDKGVSPSNVDQGYVLRRLLRRTARYLRKIGSDGSCMPQIAQVIIDEYKDIYPELERNKEFIITQIAKENVMFQKTLVSGMKEAEKYFNLLKEGEILSGDKAFKLYDTFGFPIELTKELAIEKNILVDEQGFKEKFREHQEKSRVGAAQKFKGGLVDHSEETTKLHTATHLLNAALRKVLGEDVYQRGSNINPERLRFDFSFERKMTAEEIALVESIVNEAIQKSIDVVCEEMTVDEAKAQNAIGVFGQKYGDLVKVYSIEGYSKEICGGPHVKNTKDLVSFKIQKESSSSAGVRRIKAVIGKSNS